MSDNQLCSKHIRAVQNFIDSQERRIERLKAEAEDAEQYRGLERALDALLSKLGAEVRDGAPDTTAYWQDQLAELEEALDRRLMPEGTSWPRFEDGMLVRPGDRYIGYGEGVRTARSVTLYGDGSFYLYAGGRLWEPFAAGERIKRPKPPANDDSWERLEQEVSSDATVYTSTFVRGLLSRAKALSDSDAHKPGEVV